MKTSISKNLWFVSDGTLLHKQFILTVGLISVMSVTFAQSSLIDCYEINTNVNASAPYPELLNSLYEVVYHSKLDQANPYNGEYVIMLREHPFAQNAYTVPPFASIFSFSYKMEIVSFPFSISCWNTPTACAGFSTNRELTMPNEPYDAPLHRWGIGGVSATYLNGIRENGQFVFNLNSLGYGMFSGGDTHPEALVSGLYVKNVFFIPPDWRYYLPHTAIKHTVYMHCDNFPYTPIDSIQWVYDNTRGRMRWYPFYYQNIDVGAQPIYYDILFVPEITTKPSSDFGYSDISNNSWIDGGTLDYSSFDVQLNTGNSCPSASTYHYLPNDPSFDHFREYLSNGLYSLTYGDSPPYSILTSFARNAGGTVPAGYKDQSGQLFISQDFEGIKHQYFIDRDFDANFDNVINLSILNPSEKVIYNPSEVTVDPDAGNAQGNQAPIEVIFPSGYTFKTILGRYPSVQEVTDANNDPQNGGPYADLRQVPVPVNAADLPQSPGTTANDYPSVMWDDPLTVDPNGFYHDERFGYYYIEDKATLTIETCVRIFDARFAVRSGGTMAFNDYPSILGHEVKDNFFGRYKIRGEGGAILRNFAPVQYVQNGNINQPTSLNYIALSSIIAGNDVDPDPDQPDGDYVVQANADVTFTAGNNIHLQPGFSVQGGNFHGYIDENIAVPTPCAPISSQGNPNRLLPSTSDHHSLDSFRVQVFPNPNNGSFTVSSSHPLRSFAITDLTGRLILQKENLSSPSLQITLPEIVSGILLVQVTGQEGETRMEKLVVR